MINLTGIVREKLINGILDGTYLPGEKLPPERDFARDNEISRITVRRAFAQLEALGIIIRKRPSGTYVADAFRAHSRELENIGLITTLPHEFSGRFVEAVSGCCEKEDILLALGIPQDESVEMQLKIAARMASRGVKNLIVWGAEKSGDQPLFERLRILGVNMVFFDQVIPGNFADYVGLDNFAAVETLFQRALDRGAKELIFVNYKDFSIDSNREREEAFCRCLRESGAKGRVALLSRRSTACERREVLTELPDNRYGSCAVIGANGSLIRELFPENPRNYHLFCVDRFPGSSEVKVCSYAQPVSRMAECAVEMLKNQCRKGEKWHSTQRRFAGELVEK